jgi:hypothetical protein
MPDSEKARLVMEAQIDSLTETVAEIHMRVSSIDNALRGNGRQGLFTSHALLQSRVHSIEDFVSDLKYLRRWVTVGVLALLGSVSWATIEWVMRMST